MSVFKPDRTYRLPPNPEIVTRGGKPHVRLTERGRPAYYPLTEDGTGYLKPAKSYCMEYRDPVTGKLHRESLSPYKEVAEQMEARRRRELEREMAGYKDPFAPHRKTPLINHLADWLAVPTARGRDAEYTSL
jgi:hypothetical protein